MRIGSQKFFTLGAACCLLALAGCSSTTDDGGNSAGTSGGFAGTTGATGGGGTGNPAAGSGGAAGTIATGGQSGVGGAAGTAGVGGASGVGGTGGAGGTGVAGSDCTNAGADIRTGAACEASASGIFAIKTEIDVWWQDDANPPLVDPGRGNIVVYLMGDLTGVCQDGTGGVGVMRGCGTELPLFKSDANCDAFQIKFPDALWDAPTMPTFVTTGSTTGFNPGDILTIAMATGLVGIDLADVNGTWPTTADNVTCAAGTVEACFPDHDGDGKPGVTVVMDRVGEQFPASEPKCGGFQLPFVFRGAPLDAVGALIDEGVKAEVLYIGVRTRLGGAGAIGQDCMSGTGDSQAEFVDSRVIGCTKEAPMGQPNAGVESDCSITDAQFVDSSAPIYHILNKGEAPPTSVTKPITQGGGPLDQTPSPGPRASLVRLGDSGGGFTCGSVRGANFPAFQ